MSQKGELAVTEAIPVPDAAALAPHTLLLVDDEENILASLRRLLRRDGYRILCAGGGQAGLDILAEEKQVDVIISDQRMPFMTGTEFLKQARELSPDSVRIILSGYTDLQSVTSAINEGAVYKFLTKPWDDEILRLSIKEALRHKWVQDENRMLQAMQVEVTEEFADTIQRLNAALADAEMQLTALQAIVGELPLPLFAFDEQGRVSHASAVALTLAGVAANALPVSLAFALPGVGRFSLGGTEWLCRERLPVAGPVRRLVVLIPGGGAC